MGNNAKKIERLSHCSHWGAYTLLVEEGRIVGAEPMPGDSDPSPIIQSVPDWATSSRRIARPMVREGWLADRKAGRAGNASGARRGRDRFVPLSWEEALTLVADEITRVRRDHGPAALFAGSYGWTSCGRFHHAPGLLKRMLNLSGGHTGHVDTYSIAAGPVILRHVLGTAEACNGKSNGLDAITKHTDTLLVFGALAPRTAQIEAGGAGTFRLSGALRALVARGVRVLHVSPQRDDLPEWVNARWLAIRPNTDAALMLALAQEIRRAGRHDAQFLARYTSGSERYLDYLSGAVDGVEKTAEWAAGITGIPAGDIRALADLLGRDRTMITASWSLQRAHHGEQPFWAALGLAAMLGQIGLPGGGVGFGYGSLGGVGAPFALAPSPAMDQGPNPAESVIPVARISDLLLNPGAAFDYEGVRRTYPDIRMVYWAGGNPYHHHQDLNRLERAWARPETIVVQEPMWTATALRGDIILPATTSIERNDIAGNRRSDQLVAMKRAIAPVGEARDDFDIIRDLAGRLGVGAAFDEGRDEMAWLRHLYENTREGAVKRGTELPDFETFWENGTVQVPVSRDYVHLAAYRCDPEEHPLATESGRIVLGSGRLAEWGYEDCPPQPAWMPPVEWLDDAARDAGKFHLLTPQPTGRLHSQLVTSPASRVGTTAEGREYLRLHPQDAAPLGINDGGLVKVWNQRGACLAVARFKSDLCRGVAILPTGAWFTPGGDPQAPELAGNPNVLTVDIGTSRLGQGCSAQSCLVEVAPWSGDAARPDSAFDAQIAQAVGG